MSPATGPVGLRAGWPLYLGMAVAGAAAIVASASTLAALARTAGWAGWTPWLLPAALDVGGSAGGWCWLRPGAPDRARRFGRVVALVGAAGTLVGNAAGHLIASDYLQPGPLLVVVVGAVPAAVLMTLAHLAALLTAGDERTTRARVTVRPASAVRKPRPSPPRAVAARPTPDAPEGQDLAAEATGTSEASPTAAVRLAAVAASSTRRRRATAAADQTASSDVSDTRVAVLTAIRAQQPTVAELVRATGRSRTTIVGHLTALTDEGTVVRGDDKRYRPATPSASPESEADEIESAPADDLFAVEAGR